MLKFNRGESMDLLIGMKIKTLRKNFGLTQKELAARIGIAQQTLGGYEKSKSQPDIETLKKLASFFSVSADYLLGLEEDDCSADFFNKLLFWGRRLNAANRDIIIGDMARMCMEQKQDNHGKKDIG